MKFTLNWLKDTLDAIQAGLDVESIESPAEKTKDFIVARVAGGTARGRSVLLSVSSVV